MARYYNEVITYDEATVAYDGATKEFAYDGSITIGLKPSYSILVGTFTTYYFLGNIQLALDIASPWIRGFMRIPTITGLILRLVPNSSMVIRHYLKIKEPIVTGGCPFCGTYLYNK